MQERRVLVCFDHEGRWGMPFRAAYDVEAATRTILNCLARHAVRAVFFTVGALATEKPQLIEAMAAGGHEIGLHGWRHEHLEHLTPSERSRFEDGLAESEEAIQAVTGGRACGFRAPYLLSPKFFDPDIYTLLGRRGYRYTSNREIRHVVELARPDRIRTERPWRFLMAHPHALDRSLSRMALLGLNARLWGSDCPAGSRAASIRWLIDGSRPFFRDGLLEIPLYTPLDCDLIGFPEPKAPTPPGLLDYAHFALRATMARAAPVTMLTFHDWIIAAGNRIELLDRVLLSVRQLSIRPSTVQECWCELTSLASSRCALRGADHEIAP